MRSAVAEPGATSRDPSTGPRRILACTRRQVTHCVCCAEDKECTHSKRCLWQLAHYCMFGGTLRWNAAGICPLFFATVGFIFFLSCFQAINNPQKVGTLEDRYASEKSCQQIDPVPRTQRVLSWPLTKSDENTVTPFRHPPAASNVNLEGSGRPMSIKMYQAWQTHVS